MKGRFSKLYSPILPWSIYDKCWLGALSLASILWQWRIWGSAWILDKTLQVIIYFPSLAIYSKNNCFNIVWLPNPTGHHDWVWGCGRDMAFDQIWVCQHLWHLWWISTNLSLIERRVKETWAFEEWWVHRDQALHGSSWGLATWTETAPESTVAISLSSCDSLIDWMTGGEPVHTNHSFLCTMHYLQSKCTCELFAHPLGLKPLTGQSPWPLH